MQVRRGRKRARERECVKGKLLERILGEGGEEGSEGREGGEVESAAAACCYASLDEKEGLSFPGTASPPLSTPTFPPPTSSSSNPITHSLLQSGGDEGQVQRMNGLRYKESGVNVKYPSNCAVRMSVDANTSALLACGGDAVDPALLDSIYEPKPDKRLMRVVTVIGYIFTVSMIAILLSLYYLVIVQRFFSHPLFGPQYHFKIPPPSEHPRDSLSLLHDILSYFFFATSIPTS